MATPNDTFRAVRIGLRLSQDELAKRLRDAGRQTGEPNDANKRLVQRWEGGQVRQPRPVYARALEAVTGVPVEAMGFDMPEPSSRVRADGRGGHDLTSDPRTPGSAEPAPDEATGPSFSGIWLSRYEFYSSSRENTFVGQHHVVLLQRGNRLTGRSLSSSNPDSPLTLELTVDRNVITGTWTEQTAADGYYRGARYHGAIQLLVEPTGRRMSGKWIGYGKDFDINTGPWSLVFKDASTGKAAVEKYSAPPE